MEAWKSLKNLEPMELKGFLYEKMLEILTKNIRIRVKISENSIVHHSEIEDLVRILGIFIDNAIEEVQGCSSGKMEIKIVKKEKGILFEVRNTYCQMPDINRMGREQYSSKGDGRGNGLLWVEKYLEKREDLFHELKIEGDEIVQRLEIYKIN